MFRDLIDGLRDSANVSAVFGDPVEREGRTVVPVARVGMGVGGGLGVGPENGEVADGGGGFGSGGGAMARPVGALEITDHDTRFVPVGSDRVRVAALAGLGLGLVLGRLLGRRRRPTPERD